MEAQNISFKQTCLAAPANTAFTIEFENRDSGTPHNMEIFSDAAMTQSVFKGAIITGVANATYNVSALPAGTYHFHCDIHPEMQGELDIS